MRKAKALRDPARNRTDLCLQFRIADGPDAGKLTRPYGGVWDSVLGRYVGIWDPSCNAWVGEVPKRIHIIKVAAQSLGFIEDFESSICLALGGRRSGKTTGSMAPKILVLLLLLPGLPGVVLSPTYRQSKNVWRAVLKLSPRKWWAVLHRTEHRMEMVHGSAVQFLSADTDDGARSEGSAWVGIDERQDVGDEPAGNAMLSAAEGTCPIIIETATIKPELRDHWQQLMDSPTAKVYRMRSRGNPFISHAIFDLAEEFLDKATIQRELESEWPDLVGRCYYPFQPDEHVWAYPRERMIDVTSAFCSERFDAPVFGDEGVQYLIGIDPPRHAVIAKLYFGEVLHIVDEVVVGADGKDGDVEHLVRMCKARCGRASAVVVTDPHENQWDADVMKYFRQEKFRMARLKRVHVEYRLTAVRSRLERGNLLVAPSCRHLIESLNLQTYVNNKPDKVTRSKITSRFSMDHIADALGYLIYKIWPAKVDYEKLEKKAS